MAHNGQDGSDGTAARGQAGLDDETRRDIFARALLTRRFEERIVRLAASGELPATLHVGAGQEVCQVAAIRATRDDDPLLYGHRGTGYWIARGVPLEAILCDLGGRVGGTNSGLGGVMHVVDIDRGVFGQSGTVGGNFVVGAGMALADRRLGRDTVTLVFFGDGTANRGQFHEALNYIALERLPCVFFCENNGWGLSVPVSRSTSVTDIADRALAYGIPGVVVDGNDPDEVFAATSTAVARARHGGGPTLIEAKVRRLSGHYIGDRERYRPEEERAAAQSTDPLEALRADVVARGLDDDGAIEQEVAARIDAAVEAFRAAEPVAAVDAFRARVAVAVAPAGGEG